MHRFMHKFLRAEEGATAIEYALIGALVFLAIVGSIQLMSNAIADALYSKLVTAFAS